MLLATPPPWVEYAATFLIGAGTYPTNVLLQTWYASNMIGYTKRYQTLKTSAMEEMLTFNKSHGDSYIIHVRPVLFYR